MCRYFVIVIILFSFQRLNAQTTLLAADFDSCALPAGWEVQKNGNQSSLWYVGLPANPAAVGTSIDSTCMLFIDDYATGAGTPGYTLSFISPTFDVTPYQTVELTLDVHFRFGGASFLEILLDKGSEQTTLARFDQYRTNGSEISDYFKLRYDLSVISKSPNNRLIIRYNDNGDLAWWAGVDNIRVTGAGAGTNVLTEAFNQCAQPPGWETEILTGDKNWRFGHIELGSSAFWDGNSMDGSCFVYFDDAAQGDSSPTTIRLLSPWFNGTEFFEYKLYFDAILRFNGFEHLSVYVQNAPGADLIPLYQSEGQVGGPFFPAYRPFAFDLTPFRAPQMRVVFEYTDNAYWGYWVGLDNVKVTGKGAAIDFCNQAQPLLTGDTCRAADNRMALFEGPPAACSARTAGGLWYRWTADFSGVAKLTTHADFNDVVNIYTGDCNTLTDVLCYNRDEHGFTGETVYFNCQAGVSYRVRVSGLEVGFGVPRGSLCLAVEQASGFPPEPVHDDCTAALPLAAGGACVPGTNRHADTSPALPSHNLLARADVWYKFTAASLPSWERYEIESNANFSDVITLYKGGCNSLQEIATNFRGGKLELPPLQATQTYYVQIAGNFATAEGELCPKLTYKILTPPPANDPCASAVPIGLDGACAPGDNRLATFSGQQPSCAVTIDRDIWYSFVAPAYGAVHLNTGADFEHTLTVWGGNCDSLYEVFCARNPLRCAGYVTAGNLNAGQTYYVQIASWSSAAGLGAGEVCLEILDGALDPGFKPIEIQLRQVCVGVDSARLLVGVTGGFPPYSFPALADGSVATSGQAFTVIARDAQGCEQLVTGIAAPCDSSVCNLRTTLSVGHNLCHGDSTGSIVAAETGGTGPYFFQWSNGRATAANTGLPAGVYTLTVTDANGCTDVVGQTITQPDTVVVMLDTIIRPAAGQQNGAIHVDLQGGIEPFILNWYLTDSLIANGLHDLDNIGGGLYTLQITDLNGCTQEYAWLVEELVSTGGPGSEAYAVRIYPNPAAHYATLVVSQPEPRRLELQICDAAGRQWRAWMAEPTQQQYIRLDLETLPDGIYWLEIQAGTWKTVKKIVKMK